MILEISSEITISVRVISEDLSIKKLTRGNPTMKQKFEEARAIAESNLIGSSKN